MDTLHSLFGQGEHLNMLQMSCRAFVMFFITLILLRLGGMRIFGKKSAFDTIIVIMLGAVLARGIVGASSFFATVAAAIVMIIIDRILAWASARSKLVSSLLKGQPLLLCLNGEVIWENMKTASLGKDDLLESLRLETKRNSLDLIQLAQMETNGRISFILKE
jgi:uncharacterized membrane protein YcaP (DUF421 family)